jgi:predicted dehydrogenase
VHWMVGPVTEVCGMLYTLSRSRTDAEGQMVEVDTDDLAHVWFRTKDGLLGECRASRVTPACGENNFLEVIGEEGALRAFLSRGSRDRLMLLRPGQPSEEVPLPAEASSGESCALGRMMRAFIDSIRCGSSDPDAIPTFEAGLAAQRAQEAVFRSVVGRSWQVV